MRMELPDLGEYASRALIDTSHFWELGEPLVQVGKLAEKEKPSENSSSRGKARLLDSEVQEGRPSPQESHGGDHAGRS